MPRYAITADSAVQISQAATQASLIVNVGDKTVYLDRQSSVNALSPSLTLAPRQSVNFSGGALWAICGPGETSAVEQLFDANTTVSPLTTIDGPVEANITGPVTVEGDISVLGSVTTIGSDTVIFNRQQYNLTSADNDWSSGPVDVSAFPAIEWKIELEQPFLSPPDTGNSATVTIFFTPTTSLFPLTYVETLTIPSPEWGEWNGFAGSIATIIQAVQRPRDKYIWLSIEIPGTTPLTDFTVFFSLSGRASAAPEQMLSQVSDGGDATSYLTRYWARTVSIPIVGSTLTTFSWAIPALSGSIGHLILRFPLAAAVTNGSTVVNVANIRDANLSVFREDIPEDSLGGHVTTGQFPVPGMGLRLLISGRFSSAFDITPLIAYIG